MRIMGSTDSEVHHEAYRNIRGEETFLGYGDTITAPVDLYELWEVALRHKHRGQTLYPNNSRNIKASEKW